MAECEGRTRATCEMQFNFARIVISGCSQVARYGTHAQGPLGRSTASLNSPVARRGGRTATTISVEGIQSRVRAIDRPKGLAHAYRTHVP